MSRSPCQVVKVSDPGARSPSLLPSEMMTWITYSTYGHLEMSIIFNIQYSSSFEEARSESGSFKSVIPMPMRRFTFLLNRADYVDRRQNQCVSSHRFALGGLASVIDRTHQQTH